MKSTGLHYPTKRADMGHPHIVLTLLVILLLGWLVSACDSGGTSNATSNASNNGTAATGGSQLSFPTTKPTLRTPTFSSEQVAPTVKVLASVAPTLIVQFPLVPASSIKSLFPNATATVTVMQGNPEISVFDTVIVTVQHMPPNVKYTVFFTELSAKPFGHAEYVGDVITRGDGTGESTFHLIAFVAFAADNRGPTTSADQSGTASGIQLEHVGMWFDGVKSARQVLNNPSIPGTPFDGGNPPLHAGPQVMTDGQTLPVI
ncbi:MAG TPA: hypothetical protein VKV40_20845 [Ktedonobacteraceae bacterium]|nr:hypothetical protein [Ktedonobacteraceae bacterium]